VAGMFECYWKVLDGLFVGAQDSANDLEFVVENRVTKIVNCAAWSVANSWESIGVTYLSYNWVDTDRQLILDAGDKVADEVSQFVSDALDCGEGVLIHSVHGQSRSCCICLAYLMRRFRWTLKKATEFLRSRNILLQMKPEFRRQLLDYEQRLVSKLDLSLSLEWEDPRMVPSNKNLSVIGEGVDELLVTNTYLNVTRQRQPLAGVQLASNGELTSSKRRLNLKWSDNKADDIVVDSDRSLLEEFAYIEDLDLENIENRRPPDSRRLLALKSALKGAPSLSASHGPPRVEHPESGNCDDAAWLCIRTKSGVVRCSPNEIVPKRFGLQMQRRTILLEYEVPRHGLRAHHPIRVDALALTDGRSTRAGTIADGLRKTHGPWLMGVAAEQLAELVCRLLNLEADGG